MVRVTVLASGSKGNSTLIASSRTRILVDAGLSCRELIKRMRSVGENPESLTAIVITHEHTDHVSGLRTTARKLKLPVYMTGATRQAWLRCERQQDPEAEAPEKLEFFESGHAFQIGDIAIQPFTIPHDAADPVGFSFRMEGVKIGMVTDLGYLPASIEQHLKACDGLVIESNHDLEMLRSGPYPWSVKQRVMSRVGHLSNDALAEFFSRSYDGGAAFLVLAHLSEQNNHPELARQSAERALGVRPGLFSHKLALAPQSHALEPIIL